jgi:hypothetical protein
LATADKLNEFSSGMSTQVYSTSVSTTATLGTLLDKMLLKVGFSCQIPTTSESLADQLTVINRGLPWFDRRLDFQHGRKYSDLASLVNRIEMVFTTLGQLFQEDSMP